MRIVIKIKIDFGDVESVESPSDDRNELYTCPDPQTLLSKLHELEVYKQIAEEFEIITETPFVGIYHSY